MAARDEDAARDKVRQLVLATAPSGPETGEADPDLINDLAYHSLALLELVFLLEDEFQLPPVDQETAKGIRRLSDVEAYVLTQLRSRDGSDSTEVNTVH